MNQSRPNGVSAAVEEIVRRLAEGFSPERIILFGSHARGTGTPDSDIDLLVIKKVKGSRRKLAVEMDRALIGVNAPVDLIVLTPEEVARQRDQVGTVVRPAMREGKVVYEKTA